MGLENAKEIYVEHAHKVVESIKRKRQWIVDQLEPICERAKEIEEIEKEMIEEGKNPYEEGVTDVIDPDVQNLQFESEKERLYKLCVPQLGAEH